MNSATKTTPWTIKSKKKPQKGGGGGGGGEMERESSLIVCSEEQGSLALCAQNNRFINGLGFWPAPRFLRSQIMCRPFHPISPSKDENLCNLRLSWCHFHGNKFNFIVRTATDWNHLRLRDDQVKAPTLQDFKRLITTPSTIQLPCALPSRRIQTKG